MIQGLGTVFRKVLVAAGISAVAVAVAVTGSSSAAQASNGQPIYLGLVNSESASTTIGNSSSGSGIDVSAKNGPGVAGTAYSDRYAGVLGTNSFGGGYGVEGYSPYSTGVYGDTGSSSGTGVFGENNGPSSGGGSGVTGYSKYNIGVQAISGGTALALSGVAVFSRSGRAIVPAGSKSVVVSNMALFNSSMILALVQRAGAPAVKAAVPDVANGRFTIYLAKAPTTSTTVASFILG